MRKGLKELKTGIIVKWFKLGHKLSNPNFTGSISKNGSGIRSALIIFPEGRDNSRIARYFLKSIYANGQAEIDFLMKKSLYHTFQGSLPERVKIYDEQDFNWFNLPKLGFAERIFDREYDAVVDMHPFFNLASAYLTSLSGAPIRVGFASRFSENFFNVQIDSSKSEFLERSYLAVQKLLNI
ncbi:MAG: hypothetical protein CMG75_03470 [Candidatus Marinimicrobia bacterium]|nr:hypothetical protein [Candidatus Neomarinimicrobiota bacterium]|tara:strand:- start:5878 stop:6423 length:546 start_codon:yes stop_codon:yes gene_type:complete